MVAGGAMVMVLMEHRDSRDRPKLVRRCTYPLTGRACVDVVVTDLAVLRRRDGGFVLEDLAPGFTASEVLALTEIEAKVELGELLVVDRRGSAEHEVAPGLGLREGGDLADVVLVRQ